MRKSNNTREHILAYVTAEPANEKVIKTAAQMATANKGDFTALYIKSFNSDRMRKENRERLEKHVKLAQSLGAEIITVYGGNVFEQILEYAKVSKATKVVLGYGNVTKRILFSRKTLMDKLTKLNADIDIHIVLDSDVNQRNKTGKASTAVEFPNLRSWAITIGLLGTATVLNFLFRSMNFTDANMITVYILGALLTALFTKNYICSGAFSFASVLIFNFLFTEPRLSLMAYESGYPVTFLIMLVSSLITGTLANKIVSNATVYADMAHRTNIMLETNKLMQKAEGENEIVEIMASQIGKLLVRAVVVYPVTQGELGEGKLYSSNEEIECKSLLSFQEQMVAKWVYQNGKRAGATTNIMNDALGMYISVKAQERVVCVVGIQIGTRSLEPFENSVLTAILGECGLAIENNRNAMEKEENALLAKNEQLRANLLRSISHDLRTPLTSISGNTENLLVNYDKIDKETHKQILKDVYDDSQWLINLVENLLSITRINEGKMDMNISAQLVEDVVAEVLRHINKKGLTHKIVAKYDDKILLADMDARLIMQVLTNLIDNAIKYTPVGTRIEIDVKHEGEFIKIRVSDEGVGIDDSRKEDVFKMFYTGENKVADCRRSLGLGLALCKSIINAHGSELILEDNMPSGCVFTFYLKSSEVD